MYEKSLLEIDDLTSSGRHALSEGRYDDATSYMGMALKRIEEQIEAIGKNFDDSDGESLKTLANLAETLEKLETRKRSIEYLLDKIDQEKDRAKCFREVVEGIRSTNIVSSIAKQKEIIDTVLNKPRTISQSDCYFLCLRKWNSYTPLVGTYDKPRQGGGYFLTWNGKGLVIDPGIGFLCNFLSSGFSISDIDAVIMTHSHVDHTSDFEAILTLLHEVNNLRKENAMEPHKPKIYLNIGAASKFMQLLSISYADIQERVLLDPDCTYLLFPGLSLTTCEADHSDLYSTHGKCVGLLFKMEDGERSFELGITSDTGYSGRLKTVYSHLTDSILVLHLGSILEDELNLEEPTEKVYPEHLGIRGAFNLIYDIKPRLTIISEIGEELQECICSLADKLGVVFRDLSIFPADVGLRLDLSTFGSPIGVQCQKCKNVVNIKDITYIYDSQSHAVNYLCNDCQP